MNAALLTADARRIAREPMLVLLSVLPPAFALLLRGVTGPLYEAAPVLMQPRWQATGAALLILITPMMFGFVYGLLLLDERDDGVLAAVATTPMGKVGFLRRRMLLPMLWSGIVSAALVPLAGITVVPAPAIAAGALLAALQAPMLALFLGAFAPDKAAGMALGKVGSVLTYIGALAAASTAPARWIAFPSPHFWLAEVALAGAADRPFAWIAAVGALVHVLVLALLARAFARRAG
jgi:fluoroquinolone transport system permease protein